MASSAVPWLSIVTVVRDDLDGLRETSASMAAQDIDGVEWIVVDGSSNPAPVEELVATSAFTNARYEWQEPRGIYAAMNQGLALSAAAYVYFLNAGDVLAGPDSLSVMRSIASTSGATWFYGGVRFVDVDGHAITPEPFDYAVERNRAFSGGRFPPHQGTVAQRQIMLDIGGFDTRYRIAADYAVMLQLSQRADPVATDAVLAEFREGGASTRHWRLAVSEFHRARREILRPSGRLAVVEYVRTLRQFVLLGAHRTLLSPGRPLHRVKHAIVRR